MPEEEPMHQEELEASYIQLRTLLETPYRHSSHGIRFYSDELKTYGPALQKLDEDGFIETLFRSPRGVSIRLTEKGSRCLDELLDIYKKHASDDGR